MGEFRLLTNLAKFFQGQKVVHNVENREIAGFDLSTICIFPFFDNREGVGS
jgi:hypothetical protein